MDSSLNALDVGGIIRTGEPAGAGTGVRNTVNNTFTVGLPCGTGITAGELQTFAAETDTGDLGIFAADLSVNFVKDLLSPLIVRMHISADVIEEETGNSQTVGTVDDIIEIAVADVVAVDAFKEKFKTVISGMEHGDKFLIGEIIQPRSGVNGPVFIHGFADKFALFQNWSFFKVHHIFQMDGSPEGHLVFGGTNLDMIFLNFKDESFFDSFADVDPDHLVPVFTSQRQSDTHAFEKIILKVFCGDHCNGI